MYMHMTHRRKNRVPNPLMVEIMYRCLGEVIDLLDLAPGWCKRCVIPKKYLGICMYIVKSYIVVLSPDTKLSSR